MAEVQDSSRLLRVTEVRHTKDALVVRYSLPDAPDLRFHDAKDDQGRACRSPRYGSAVTGQQVAEVGPLPLPARTTP